MALGPERAAYAQIRKLLARYRTIQHMDPSLRVPWDEGPYALIDWEPLDVLVEALTIRATIRFWREIDRVGVQRAKMDHTWGVGARWAVRMQVGVSQLQKRGDDDGTRRTT